MLRAVRFFSLLFVALALAPGLAHLFALPNKIGMDADDYLAAQQIYRGWALLGALVIGALFFTLVHAVLVRGERRRFVPALIAFLCIAGTQAIFWTLTFPANEATANWTLLPDSWQALRAQWEYSHAAAAALGLAAMVASILAVL